MTDAEENGKEFGGPNDENVRKMIEYYKSNAECEAQNANNDVGENQKSFYDILDFIVDFKE